MALVVEDGTGKSTADAYVSIADVTSYATDFTTDAAAWSALEVASQERAIRLATLYLDQTYGTRWRGRKANSDNALDWPRTGVWDKNNFLLEHDEIPVGLKRACSILALESGVRATTLDPDLSADEGTVRSKTETLGPLSKSVEYVGGTREVKRYTRVEQQLSGLIGESGRLYRA